MTLTIRPGITIKPGINVTVPLPAPYSVITSSSSVNEGSTITFTSTSTGVPNGTLYWTRYGGAANDADFSAVNGSFTVTNGVGTFTVTPVADHLTEGTELFSVVVRTGSITGPIIGTSAGKQILDTSQTPTYTLSTVGNVTSINEGVELTFNVTTTDVEDGTTLYWGIGVGGGNMSFGRVSATSGSVTVASNAASFGMTISADNLTSPSQQSYLISLFKDGPGGLGGVKVDDIQIDVNDTSQTPPAHGSGLINQPQNDYLKIYAPGTGCIQRDSDAYGDYYLSSGTMSYITFNPNEIIESLTAGWTIKFANGQTRTITYVNYFSEDNIYQINFSPSFTYAPYDVFPLSLRSPDFVTRPWNLGTTWTVEFSMYANSSSVGGNQQGGIWGLLNQGGWATKDSINIALSGGVLQVNLGGSTSYNNLATSEPIPQQWVHVAVVNNAGTVKVYYNGKEQVQISGSNMPNGSGDGSWTNDVEPLFIGCLGSSSGRLVQIPGGGSFDGKITNLRITDTAEYTANFTTPTTPPTLVAGHTRLLWTPTDEALATDTSDTPRVITNNGVTYSSSYPAVNTARGSAVFGSSSFIQVGRSGTTPWALGTTWTIEWWSNATTATVLNGAGLWTVMSAGVGNNLIDIYYQNNLMYAGNDVSICTEPPAGVWTHVAMVTSSGSTKVYYNGIAQSVNAVNYNLTNSSAALYIGCRGNNLFQNFIGKLTNIRITDTEVYTTNFVPDQLPTVIADHTKLLYTPTVDTMYSLAAGGLAIATKQISYSSDYQQAFIGLVHPYPGGTLGNTYCIAANPRFAEAMTIPVGARINSNIPGFGTRTVTNLATIGGDRVISYDPTGLTGFTSVTDTFNFFW
jgi:hypothetical protein